MISNRKITTEFGVRAEIATFAPKGKTAEHHIIFHVDAQNETFTEQLSRLNKAVMKVTKDTALLSSKIVFKRYLLSDIANQESIVLEKENENQPHLPYGLSLIQQPPFASFTDNGTFCSKVALWMYMHEAEEVIDNNSTICISNNGYEHLWNMGMRFDDGSSFDQTDKLLGEYKKVLTANSINIADNCIRTWFFVRDVDIQYQGMVKARREFFDRNGLTTNTHYIASTGIYGIPGGKQSIVMLDSYALKGMKSEQQKYLYAPEHLNRTSDYGVTFERGTVLSFGDRNHLFISGTASINNKGQVVHVGDIRQQTRRMWENVEALLSEGGAGFSDIMQIIVYIRDIADYPIVAKMFQEKFPTTPYVITQAPVCRPQWLIEMECIAVKPSQNKDYRDF